MCIRLEHIKVDETENYAKLLVWNHSYGKNLQITWTYKSGLQCQIRIQGFHLFLLAIKHFLEMVNWCLEKTKEWFKDYMTYINFMWHWSEVFAASTFLKLSPVYWSDSFIPGRLLYLFVQTTFLKASCASLYYWMWPPPTHAPAGQSSPLGGRFQQHVHANGQSRSYYPEGLSSMNMINLHL